MADARVFADRQNLNNGSIIIAFVARWKGLHHFT
jgi:hypothetical protein